MIIEYLKLKNFKGIMAGMGRKEIEIDFTKCEKRIILFLGANGSGKSTIMSTLHPFMESFDSRDSLILDDHEGYKEIHIRKGGDLYRIEHYYGKGKNKSFIYKNDESLNESGGIRTFIAIVEEELGVNAEFFKIVKIGSNSKNFIDLQASARKQFLGKFTPSIDMYINAYKVVNDKLNLSNKEIKYITDEMSKLEDKEEVKSRIDVIGKTLKKTSQNVAKLAAEIISTQREVETAKKAVAEFAEELAEREAKTKELAEKQGELEEVYSDYPKLREYDKATIAKKIGSLNSEIKDLTKRVNELTLELERLQGARVAATNNRNAAQIELKKYSKSSTTSVDELKELLSKYRGELKEVEKQFKEIKGVGIIDGIVVEDATSDSAQAQRLAMDIVEGKRLVADFDEEYIELMFTASEQSLKERIESDELLAEKKEAEISKLKRELRSAEDERIASKTTIDVASLCRSKTCEVYKIGLSHKEKADELTEKKETIEKAEIALQKIQTRIACLKAIRTKAQLFQSGVYMFVEMSPSVLAKTKLAEVFKEHNRDIGMAVYDMTAEEVQSLFDMSPVVRKVNLAKKIEDKKAAIENTASKIESMSDVESFVGEINDRISKANDEITRITPKEAEVKEGLADAKESLEKKESAKDLIETLQSILAEVAAIEKDLKALNKIYENNLENIERISTAEQKVKDLEGEKETLDESVTELTKEVATYSTKLARIEEYEERKANLMDSREVLKVVKDALDIKTGIPLHILGSYLDGIKEETNRLLTLALGDGFAIDFNVSDTDFSIPVYKNGFPYAKDITECSQGETALVKCSLSLGITSRAIRQSDTKYNLVYLDEVDAELDTTNRYKFLDILEKQLDALACEQCFVITHNEAFASAEIGVVLLKGANFDTSDETTMFNKTVVADFRRKNEK
jgi:DNA repair exonuclease SbcCD ATPase subunit